MQSGEHGDTLDLVEMPEAIGESCEGSDNSIPAHRDLLLAIAFLKNREVRDCSKSINPYFRLLNRA